MPDSSPTPRSSRPSASELALKQTKTVQVWVQGRRKPTLKHRLLRSLGITAGLLGAGIFAGVCLWISVVFILHPNPPRWLAQTLPYFSMGWGDMPAQSLEEIEAELQAQGRQAGKLVNVASFGTDPQLGNLRLLPIFATRSSCTRDCQAIVELRLYGVHSRDPQASLQLLDQLTIQGPPEEQVLDPILQPQAGVVGSTHPLPLSEVKSLKADALPGGWLTLTGRWQHQGSPVLYGQILHVDSQTLRINSLLNWNSPPGRLPVWRNLDETGLPELVVNQSVGLEPRFSLYTIANTTASAVATRLEEISLSQIALPQGVDKAPYRNALFLAQHGLWSEAQRRLTQLKTQWADQWPQGLEQQLQLVSLHAEVSQSQAARDWSRASQKLLALLLDGQWDNALKTLDTPQSGFRAAVLPLLEQNSTRLWQRLTASLQVNSGQKAARLWGALLLLAKEDEDAALKWLNQAANASIKSEFDAIAAEIQPQSPDGNTAVTVATQPNSAEASTANVAMSGLFGTARSLTDLNPNKWHQPAGMPELTLPSGQQWYEITLQAGHLNQRWSSRLGAPDDDSPAAIAAFWQALGLDTHAALQRVASAPGQSSQTVQVRALQWQSGRIQLLASGASSPEEGPWIVTTPRHWGTSQQTSAQSWSQVYRDRPELGNRLLTTISNHLGLNATALASALPAAEAAGTRLATVRWVDFTGDSDADLFLTLEPQALAQAGSSLSVQTEIQMVISPQGDLLYSNLWAEGSHPLIGWLKPNAGAAALVTAQGNTYRLLTWSPTHGQFR
ncbi:MAG: hypothetical protein F6J95_016645 [Leptolyngbya sp. SIO1E4]|nr:hypothetical protein [Leptolyngbya sp. SIO1E4]